MKKLINLAIFRHKNLGTKKKIGKCIALIKSPPEYPKVTGSQTKKGSP